MKNNLNSHLNLFNYSQAEKDASESIRLNPSYVKSFVRRGTAFHKMGNLKAAL